MAEPSATSSRSVGTSPDDFLRPDAIGRHCAQDPPSPSLPSPRLQCQGHQPAKRLEEEPPTSLPQERLDTSTCYRFWRSLAGLLILLDWCSSVRDAVLPLAAQRKIDIVESVRDLGGGKAPLAVSFGNPWWMRKS